MPSRVHECFRGDPVESGLHRSGELGAAVGQRVGPGEVQAGSPVTFDDGIQVGNVSDPRPWSPGVEHPDHAGQFLQALHAFPSDVSEHFAFQPVFTGGQGSTGLQGNRGEAGGEHIVKLPGHFLALCGQGEFVVPGGQLCLVMGSLSDGRCTCRFALRQLVCLAEVGGPLSRQEQDHRGAQGCQHAGGQ